MLGEYLKSGQVWVNDETYLMDDEDGLTVQIGMVGEEEAVEKYLAWLSTN